MKTAIKELHMAVKTLRKGLNRETRALLEYVRRARFWTTPYSWPLSMLG